MNTLAVAEKWAGDALTARDFVTLSVGRGIGLGIVIDRSLYRGATGGSGEFGHMIVDRAARSANAADSAVSRRWWVKTHCAVESESATGGD